jgi:hypothetical protein
MDMVPPIIFVCGPKGPLQLCRKADARDNRHLDGGRDFLRLTLGQGAAQNV